jgi:hypothetical protein
MEARCRSLLPNPDGMSRAQQLMSDQALSTMDAILVTRELLGGGQDTLGLAKRIVLTHPSRHADLLALHAFVDELDRS